MDLSYAYPLLRTAVDTPLRTAIETFHTKAGHKADTKTITFDGDHKAEHRVNTGTFIKGRVTVKIDSNQNSNSVCITVSPPAPFRCILKDPDSTRTTEMVYADEEGKFIRAHVIPRNEYRGIPAHIVFHVEWFHFADMQRIVARIASCF
jgi:hypothetical protein